MTHRTAALLDHIAPVRGAPAASAALRALVCVMAGVILLALLSQVRVPTLPVPFTGQTLGVLLVGGAFGAPLGLVTVVAYLLLGSIGLPLFAGAESGVAYALGPTGGYLLGFALAAGVLGYLSRRGWDRNVLTCAAAMVLANALIYVPGLLWLRASLHLSWEATLAAGLTPFLLGDLIKLLTAAAALPAAWRAVGRRAA
ncbi:MAG TPA: biotin transporter BioY [Trueperaceae bacterium]